MKSCWFIPGIGCCIYNTTHIETFVPAGHVGFLMNEKNEYLFMQPGMHNIKTCFTRQTRSPKKLRGHIEHGNRTIVIVDQGYAAVTQDNGKQVVLPGGHTHLLTHKNHKFEKFITLKIQTDELEKIQATSADNINMMVNSTVNWRIVDLEVAATMAAETMATSGKSGDVSADITKLRRDVLKQSLASLAAFIGSVNYSESFHMSAAAAGARKIPSVEGQLLNDSNT